MEVFEQKQITPISNKNLEQYKEIQQNSTGPRYFGICFWEIFGYYFKFFFLEKLSAKFFVLKLFKMRLSTKPQPILRF